MENTQSKVMRPVLVRKGEALPDTVMPMTETEVLDIQNKRIEKFTPKSEMRIFQYGSHVMVATTALSAFVVNTILRKNFRLGGLKMVMSYGASVCVPSVLSAALNELYVRPKVLLGMESCPTCLSMKAAVVQSLMGLCYPFVISFVTCLTTSREYFTLDIATNSKRMGYFRLIRQVSPSSNILLALGLLNMTVGMEVARRQMKAYVQHLSKPPSEYGNVINE
ncbi:unnamed protein product [Candidula unifasciata]|uniref:Uncharacterized protein n=1 Tax=Candidula unifasciata TaxID=100452 RepID=A0A8S3YX09_9EUPU|nr:unnamed protein product [Candidula unifasciata]